jgi:hypothetical protein
MYSAYREQRAYLDFKVCPSKTEASSISTEFMSMREKKKRTLFLPPWFPHPFDLEKKLGQSKKKVQKKQHASKRNLNHG